jgi:hypothetical protein
MGTKHALKDIKIKDSKIPRISMCGGGCGQGYHYDPPSCGGGCSLGLGFVETVKYLYNSIKPTPKPPKEKTKEEILEELKRKYPKELFDEYDYIQGMWIKKKKK